MIVTEIKDFLWQSMLNFAVIQSYCASDGAPGHHVGDESHYSGRISIWTRSFPPSSAKSHNKHHL